MRMFHTLVLIVLALVWVEFSYSAEAKSVKKISSAKKAMQPRVFFVEPKDGAEVPQEFVAKFGVEGMKLKPAGDSTENSGHFHLLIDEPALPKWTDIPIDEKHIHYGGAQKEGKVKLTPGTHTLTLQFGDGTHFSMGPEMASTITVHVK